jgi:hypothetical protein
MITRRLIKDKSNAARSFLGGVAIWIGIATPVAGETLGAAPPGRSIAYAVTDLKLSVFESEGAKQECPNGVNKIGPREIFKIQFPQDADQKWTQADTQLAREAEIWHPTVGKADDVPFVLAEGKTGLGVNLDDRVDSNDFTSPDGKTCSMNYRTGASIVNSERDFLVGYGQFNRLLIEITDVDSLINDDEVTLTTYRGRDRLLKDAQGGFQSGGTQRVDLRFSRDFIHAAKGKIVDGVLISEPVDILVPQQVAFSSAATTKLRGARFELKLLPDKADGFIGGYLDVESYYQRVNRAWGTHFMSYGQQIQPSVYRALRRLADGFRDPNTGEFTAISGSYSVRMIQVRTIHPPKEVADTAGEAAGSFSSGR